MEAENWPIPYASLFAHGDLWVHRVARAVLFNGKHTNPRDEFVVRNSRFDLLLSPYDEISRPLRMGMRKLSEELLGYRLHLRSFEYWLGTSRVRSLLSGSEGFELCVDPVQGIRQIKVPFFVFCFTSQTVLPCACVFGPNLRPRMSVVGAGNLPLRYFSAGFSSSAFFVGFFVGGCRARANLSGKRGFGQAKVALTD